LNLVLSHVRRPEESLGAFRLRYARYCLTWAYGLSAALLLLLAWRPSVQGSAAPLAGMFFYIGLPIAAATALIAAAGLAMGGGWAILMAKSPTATLWWGRVKETLIVLFAFLPTGFALYEFASGLVSRCVLVPVRGHTQIVHWATEPWGFVISMAVWGVLGVYLTRYLIRRLLRAYAI